jgi:hypothetical protein
MTRNIGMNCAQSVLQQQPHAAVIRLNSGVWHEAIVRLARNPFGFSAIFLILQKRPGLLEPRLRPLAPTSTVATTVVAASASSVGASAGAGAAGGGGSRQQEEQGQDVEKSDTTHDVARKRARRS